MTGALSGIRIIDLSTVVSGPMAVQILADQGADVIKVEQPEAGDSSRHMGAMRNGMAAMFALLNRNKRSIVLDMQQAAARDILFGLVKTADVIVQNFRPGAMERMGIDYPALKKINDSLIYTSISGFGADGPYAKRRVYDPVIQAITGFVSCQTGTRTHEPELVKNILCDKATALMAAQAITAALFARERGGGGQSLEVAMVDAGLAFLWPDGMWNHTLIGEDIRPMPSLSDIYRVTETADGYITYLTVSDAEWRGMCRAINRPELGSDAKFENITGRLQHIDELIDILTTELGRWNTDEICARLDAEEVPFAKVNLLDEVHLDPQIAHRGSLIEIEHPSAGRMRMPGPTARFTATPSSIRYLAPTLGQHTDEILAELGHSPAAIAALRDTGTVA